MPELKYDILETLAELPEGSGGYHIELNLIKWGDNDPKYDLRRWNSDRSKMTKGITLTRDELMILKEKLGGIEL